MATITLYVHPSMIAALAAIIIFVGIKSVVELIP